jgi:hypothetical protein
MARNSFRYDLFAQDDTDPMASHVRRALRPSFNPPDLTGVASTTSVVGDGSDTEDVYDKTLRSLSETGPAMKKYTDFVANVPKEGDYQPNWMTRIGAAVSGAAAGMRNPSEGVAVAQRIRDEPYRSAVEQYHLQERGLAALAAGENDQRQNQLGLIKAIRDNQIKMRELGTKETTANASMINANANKAYREAMVDDLKRKGWVFYTDDKGHRIGTLMGQNGVQQKQDFGPSEEATKISQKNRELNQADTRNAAYGRMAGAAETNATANQTRANESFSPPNQQFYAESMATQQAVRENPDWAGFVDKNGRIKTSVGIFGGDPRRYPGSRPGVSGYDEFTKRVQEIKDEIIKKNRMPMRGFGSMFNGNDDVIDIPDLQ